MQRLNTRGTHLVTDELLNFFSRSPVRITPNDPVIVNDGTYENICPGGVIIDPNDSSKSIFYCGEFLGSISVGARVSYFLIDNATPYTLGTRQGIVLTATAATEDAQGARFGCVLTVAGTVYYFYVGIDDSFEWRIMLATSTDGRSFTKQGVVLDFNGTDEFSVSDPYIVEDGGTYYMIYTAWDGIGSPPNNNPGSSKVGIKLATSTNLTDWTKTGTVLVPLGAAGTLDDNNVEGGQLLKVGDKWAILYNGNDGTLWQIFLAYSDTIDAVFTKRTQPWFKNAPSDWDSLLVAVPLICEFAVLGSQQRVMYYQALSAAFPEDIDVGASTIYINHIVT